MKLKRVNDLLLGAIILVCLYIIATPFVPSLSFWWQNRGGTKTHQLTVAIHTKLPASQPTNQPNGVMVPAMLLNQPILEGTIANQYKTLDKGIWRWPLGSTPDKNSNTVLIGHRFTYTNPRGVFYHMDKLAVGDEIGITWNNKKYVYKVNQIKIVPPTDTSIEDATKQPQLTMFTCTPLWWPENRLVVIAGLET